jgi:hypothetical protein
VSDHDDLLAPEHVQGHDQAADDAATRVDQRVARVLDDLGVAPAQPERGLEEVMALICIS